MQYNHVKEGIFLERPNRFIAHVEIEGKLEVCHVKNTGRCKELLIPGVTVYVEEAANPNRKTKYDLIGVVKKELLINIDSQAPNQVVKEWLLAGGLYPNPTLIQPERKFKNARLDFYVEDATKKAFIEVKGVTLIENGVAMFPDAPTVRGVKHIHHLIELKEQGYEVYILFLIQLSPVLRFQPNDETHKEFGDALRFAQKRGVNILAYDCAVTKDSISIKDRISDIRL